MKTENISRRNFLKILGGIGALGLFSGISLKSTGKPRTNRVIAIKAEPIYKGVI